MTNRSAAIAVFVKTPGLSPIKTRLAGGLGTQKSEEFYRLSVAAVEATVADSANSTGACPYWAVAEDAGLSHPMWQRFSQISQGEGGLGNRLHKVFSELREQHAVVVGIGADAPQLTTTALEASLLRLLDKRSRIAHVLGRCFDGGFYLVGTKMRLLRETWSEVSYSTENAAGELATNLGQYGEILELGRLVDVDQAEDLTALRDEFMALTRPTAEQAAVISWIEQESCISSNGAPDSP
jgi:glycosyltransferase A (GT-A) superfamily protein (DUF2064 family)